MTPEAGQMASWPDNAITYYIPSFDGHIKNADVILITPVNVSA
jgi:hypothetical protein